MCFSAGASFTGGIIISVIGVVTIKKVHKPSQIVFACIPLFFGFQQLVEGVVWLTIPVPEYAGLQKIATYSFQIMALVIWPLMIPFSVLHMEKSKKRQKILFILLIMGAILSLYYSYCLLFFNVNPQIKGYHVQYNNNFPISLAMISFLFYLVVTITPLFVSSIKRTHLLAILMTLSCLITAIFFKQYLTSVWCFFAALISMVILWILHDSRKTFNLEKLQLLLKPVIGKPD
jgi:uncharacterized membrane protein (UPF0136 family)